MARHRAQARTSWRREDGRHGGGAHTASRAAGAGRRRAVLIAVPPLAVSAVTASAFAVVPHLTPEPATQPPVVRVETRALAADHAVVADEPVLAPAVAVPRAESARQPRRGRLRAVADYQPLVSDIPSESLAAYQRAETVMDEAAPRCRLDWSVLAGVAEVESDHGREGDSTVTARGVSRPGVFGKALNGRHGRERVRDTDAGVTDGNARWDAPAGPMGLLPSTWSVVAVDSDGDGRRNLQDVDDAALGVAVFLCDGARDLGAADELRAALAAFNPAPGYARMVMSLARAYRADHTTTPTLPPTVAALPDLPELPPSAGNADPGPDRPHGSAAADQDLTIAHEPPEQEQEQPAPSPGGGGTPSPSPTTAPTPSDTPSQSPTPSESTSPSSSQSPAEAVSATAP